MNLDNMKIGQSLVITAERDISVVKKLDALLKGYTKFKGNRFDKVSFIWTHGDKFVAPTHYPPASVNVSFGNIASGIEDAPDKENFLSKNASNRVVLREFNKVESYEGINPYEFLKSKLHL